MGSDVNFVNNSKNRTSRPSLTTRDMKRIINITVHAMLDNLVDNKNILFTSTTTDVPSNDRILSVTKQGVSTPFIVFHQNEKWGNSTHIVSPISTSGDLLNELQNTVDIIGSIGIMTLDTCHWLIAQENKIDVSIEKFMKHYATLNNLCGTVKGMSIIVWCRVQHVQKSAFCS